MGALDSTFRAGASELIRSLGATATLRRVSQEYDAASDQGTDTVFEASIRVSPPEPYRSKPITGTQVQTGDAKCYVAAVDLEATGIVFPPPSRTVVYLILGADRWTVVEVNHLRSGDQSAALELHLRR